MTGFGPLTMWRRFVAVAGWAVACVACGAVQHREAASDTPAPTLTCSDSIYTASLRPGAIPKEFKAIVIGPAIFNVLQEARDPSLLERSGALLVYKSPLTIAATGEVTITASSVHAGRIVVLYGKDVPYKLATGKPHMAAFPVADHFRLCGYAGRALRVPQFAGGFGVSRPGCYRIEVERGRRSTSRVVSLGAGLTCAAKA